MGIFVTSHDRVIIQGMTGRTGRAAAARMSEDGTPLVGGISPRRGGTAVAGKPIFGTVRDAVASVAATASFISVPPPWTLEAAIEAIEAGIRTIVIYTEHVPIQDAMRIRSAARQNGCIVLGPNSAGCVTPGQANLSDLDSRNLRAGRIGVVSKSGTLTYEIVDGLVRAGEGLSTVVCLGGDPVIGSDHATVLDAFEHDPMTDVVIAVGEIGGVSEDQAATVISRMSTPVVALVVGHHAPPGRRMGHAGALMTHRSESAAAKSARLTSAGATVVSTISDVVPAAIVAARAR